MKFRFAIPLLGALMASPAAWAVEALSTEELVSHCDKYYDEQATEDRVFCVRYVQGFIDGAVATDERVARNAMQPRLDATAQYQITGLDGDTEDALDYAETLDFDGFPVTPTLYSDIQRFDLIGQLCVELNLGHKSFLLIMSIQPNINMIQCVNSLKI